MSTSMRRHSAATLQKKMPQKPQTECPVRILLQHWRQYTPQHPIRCKNHTLVPLYQPIMCTVVWDSTAMPLRTTENQNNFQMLELSIIPWDTMLHTQLYKKVIISNVQSTQYSSLPNWTVILISHMLCHQIRTHMMIKHPSDWFILFPE